MANSLVAPFSAMDTLYTKGFELFLDNVIGKIETAVAGPLLTVVTLWVIVQGILIMRGDVDARQGLTKLISVAIVVSLVASSNLYQEYVSDLFRYGIPNMVQEMGGNGGLSTSKIPLELDAVFNAGQGAFQKVAAEIPQMDDLDSMAFDAAQFFFYFTLWSIFGICDLVTILTSVLIAIGPLMILGFLFEATKGVTTRWIGQLISYGILLLLVSIVAEVVLGVIATGMGAAFAVTIAANTTSGQLVGLYEMDLFIMTGNALIVALPGIAAALGGGVAAQGMQLGQSIYRRFANKPSKTTMQNMGFIS